MFADVGSGHGHGHGLEAAASASGRYVRRLAIAFGVLALMIYLLVRPRRTFETPEVLSTRSTDAAPTVRLPM